MDGSFTLTVPEGSFIATIVTRNSEFRCVCSSLEDAIASFHDFRDLIGLYSPLDCFVRQIRFDGDPIVFSVR